MGRYVLPIFVAAGLHLQVSAACAQHLKHPDWHPGGIFLVAEGTCAGGTDLFLINTESHDVRLLWDGGMAEGYPRWFAGGKRIAFHQVDKNRNSKVFVGELARDGHLRNVTAVTSGPFDIEPSPSPDGTSIVYSQRGENGQDIALVDLRDTGGSREWETDLAENFPSWRPDGSAIIFHAKTPDGMHIFQRDLVSDHVIAISPSAGPDFTGHFDAQGKRLVYSSEREGDREIYLYDLADGSDRRLTDRPGRDGYPKFSPDGLRVAYHSAISETSTEISIMSIGDGSVARYSCDCFSAAAGPEILAQPAYERDAHQDDDRDDRQR